MSKRKTDAAEPSAAERHAKGAARTTIGKLAGDDAAIRQGRQEQRSSASKTPDTSTEENTWRRT